MDAISEPAGRPLTRDAPVRLIWLDTARTVALLGMAVFHYAHDLAAVGLIDPDTTRTGGWAVFARLIAGTFLFLSGVSFTLAHGSGVKAHAWARRLLVIVAAAALVSAATYAAFPARFIYFGILHAIAAASVIGLAFLRAPAWLVAGAALAITLADAFVGPTLFASPWLAWTGLSAAVRPTLDYIPLVPWLAVFLTGMAFAKAVPPARLEPRWPPSLPMRRLSWPGRHSLAVYLVHQPVLFGLILSMAWALGR